MIISGKKEFQLLTEIFLKFGFNKRDASLISKSLEDADSRGIYSHGIQRLTMYEKKLNLGFIDPKADSKILKSTSTCIVVDAQHVMGQLASVEVVNHLIKLCKKNGIAVATVRNSNHFGAAGYYARMASQKNLIGFAATSTNPLLVPPGATEPFLGSNPFAISFPLKETDFTFDGATSTVSLGKIEVLQKLNRKIPGEWAIDEAGNLESRPSQVIERLTQDHRTGGILPIGGNQECNSSYKGFALSLIIEIFTSIFSEGSIAADLGNKNHDISHFFMVIDPNLFTSLDKFEKSLTDMLKRLKRLRTISGSAVMLPGEKEKFAFEKTRENGIKIDCETFKQVKRICNSLNINLNKYL